MHVLITWGCGYIGKILTAKLLAIGYYVDVLDLAPDCNAPHSRYRYIRSDIVDISDIDGSLYSLVVHLAAEKNVSICELDPQRSYHTNVLGTKSLTNFCLRYSIKKIIFASTAWVYGASNVPVDERSNTDPSNTYSMHKLESENILRQWSEQSLESTVFILRFFNVVWVDAEFNLDEDPVSGENLFCIILRHLMGIEGPPFFIHTIPNFGTPYRDFVNVKDIIRAIVLLIEDIKVNWLEIYNISTWVSTSIDRVIDTFQKISKCIIHKKYIQAPDYVVPISKCEPMKFYQKYWFRPSISVKDSITETIHYYNIY
jgi:UDP-glucose 4-epimerase